MVRKTYAIESAHLYVTQKIFLPFEPVEWIEPKFGTWVFLGMLYPIMRSVLVYDP